MTDWLSGGCEEDPSRCEWIKHWPSSSPWDYSGSASEPRRSQIPRQVPLNVVVVGPCQWLCCCHFNIECVWMSVVSLNCHWSGESWVRRRRIQELPPLILLLIGITVEWMLWFLMEDHFCSHSIGSDTNPFPPSGQGLRRLCVIVLRRSIVWLRSLCTIQVGGHCLSSWISIDNFEIGNKRSVHCVQDAELTTFGFYLNWSWCVSRNEKRLQKGHWESEWEKWISAVIVRRFYCFSCPLPFWRE